MYRGCEILPFLLVMFTPHVYGMVVTGKVPSVTWLKNKNNTLDVYFDSDSFMYTVNWTRIVQSVPKDQLMELWNTAGIFTSLDNMLGKRDDILQTNDTIRIQGHPNFVCPSAYFYPVLPKTIDWKKFQPGYLAKYGIAKKDLIDDLYKDQIHELLYSERMGSPFLGDKTYAGYGNFSWEINGTTVAYGVVTDMLAYVLINATYGKEQCEAIFLFGHKEHFPSFQSHISPDRIEVGTNGVYSLYFITKNNMAGCNGNTAYELNLPELFASLVLMGPKPLVKTISDAAAFMTAVNCNQEYIPMARLITTFVRLTSAHFLFLSGISLTVTNTLDAGCTIEILADLRFAREGLLQCGLHYSPHMFTSNFLAFVAGTQIEHLPNPSYIKTADIPRVMSMVRYGISEYNVSTPAFSFLEKLFEDIYREYSYDYTLKPSTRKILLDVSETLKHIGNLWNVTTKDLLKLYTIATSMCSNMEISTMVERHDPIWSIDSVETFSPCYISLRFDFSANKINLEVEQSSKHTPTQIEKGISGFLTDLHVHHLQLLSTLPFIKCLKKVINHTDVILPITGLTYVISKEPVPGVTVYDISETFLESKMVISVFKDDCSPALADSDTHKTVPVIYNVTNTKCKFCGSVILSYDEAQGFLSAMYVTDKTVQSNLFLPTSPFFADGNAHVHYLWLMNNGSVVEIRGAYRRQIMSVFILFIVIALVFLISLMIIKVIKYIFF